MAFKRPSNPQTISTAKMTNFDGIGGGNEMVLRRTNSRGWDLSNSVYNDMQDLDCIEGGTILLRDGCRKTSDTGLAYAIDGLFELNIGSVKAYAIVYGGIINIESMSAVKTVRQVDTVEVIPATTLATITSEYVNSDPSI